MAGPVPPQYNVDESTKNLLLEKAKRRAVLREEFLKLKHDPFRHASQEGGYVFDAAAMRHQAMKISFVKFFKPTTNTISRTLAFIVLPTALMYWAVKNSQEEKEAQYRRGEIAYRDRKFKFI